MRYPSMRHLHAPAALQINKSLRTLIMRDNPLGQAGARRLLKAVHRWGEQGGFPSSVGKRVPFSLTVSWCTLFV